MHNQIHIANNKMFLFLFLPVSLRPPRLDTLFVNTIEEITTAETSLKDAQYGSHQITGFFCINSFCFLHRSQSKTDSC